MSATLDGIGIDPSDAEPYVIEVKSISRKGDDWTDDTVPVHYYIQVLHQLSVTGWKKAVLLARFCRTEWGGDSAYERCYYFDRAELEKEISSLEKVEEKFWNECVVGGMRPAVRVPEV
jgi:predicted phage-related endonuclease